MKNIIKKVLILTLALVPLLSMNVKAQEKEVIRISGKDRYQTAINVSQEQYNSSKFAIVASGEKFPDALAGGSISTQIKAPILLVQHSAVPNGVIEELNRLGVEHVFLLGGTGTISVSVERKLANNVDSIERIAGSNRYETSIKITAIRSRLLEYRYGEDVVGGDIINIVNGNDYPTALAAAPFCGQLQLGKYLVGTFFLTPQNSNYYAYMVFGDEDTIKTDEEAFRIAGNNKYGTAVEIAKLYPPVIGKIIDTVVIADGTNFPDALACSGLLGNNNAAILLTDPDTLPTETRKYIEGNPNIKKVIIVGGENSVAKNIEEELEIILANNPIKDTLEIPTEPGKKPRPSELLTRKTVQTTSGSKTHEFLDGYANAILYRINQERKSYGVHELDLDLTFKGATDIRASEISEVLSVNRPDGTSASDLYIETLLNSIESEAELERIWADTTGNHGETLLGVDRLEIDEIMNYLFSENTRDALLDTNIDSACVSVVENNNDYYIVVYVTAD